MSFPNGVWVWDVAAVEIRLALTTSLLVRRTRLSTVGARAFPIAAAHTLNVLPRHITSAASLFFEAI